MTPPALDAVGKVSIIDAVALRREHRLRRRSTRFRLDDLRPHIYRTRDGGKTLDARSSAAFPTAASSTPCARTRCGAGLLFAGTEQRGLRLVRRRRPLAVAAAEHAGDVDPRPRRSRTTTSSSARTAAAFWILDDITPLRQIDAGRRARRRRSCSRRRRPGASAGTRTPTRRCRPTSRPGRTRPTARSSTTA